MSLKPVLLVLAFYSVAIGVATFASSAMTDSPTFDTVAGLPSAGSLLHSTGTTAALLDFATAGGLWWFAMRG